MSFFLEPRPQTPEVPSLCASPKTSLRPPGPTGRALRIPGSALKAPGRLLGPRNTGTCSKTQSRQTIGHRCLQLNEVRRHCKRQGSEACSPPAFVAVLQRLWRTREDKKTPAGERKVFVPTNGLRGILITCCTASRPIFLCKTRDGRDAQEPVQGAAGLTWFAAPGLPAPRAGPRRSGQAT